MSTYNIIDYNGITIGTLQLPTGVDATPYLALYAISPSQAAAINNGLLTTLGNILTGVLNGIL